MARLRSALFCAAALLLACGSAAEAQWRIVSSERKDSGRAGVTHVVAQAENESGARATVQFAVFNSKTATLRVIDDPPDTHASLAETMQRENCIAGVNGGYFDPQGAPVGLLISDGRVVMQKQKARLLSGVVSVVNGRVQIQR